MGIEWAITRNVCVYVKAGLYQMSSFIEHLTFLTVATISYASLM